MPASQAKLVFPINLIAAALSQKASNQFAVAPVQDPMHFIIEQGGKGEKPLTEGFWTILQDKFKSTLEQVAMQVVLEDRRSGFEGSTMGTVRQPAYG